MLGADRLGMELHAPGGPLTVADRHQRAVIGPGDRLELGRQRRLDDQRVVADGAKALRDAGEQPIAAMKDPADPAVDDLRRAHDAAAAHVREPLMAEADAEHGDLALCERRPPDAEIALALGATRPR